MRRAPIAKSAAIAIVALCSLIAVASASAAAWQGPVPISPAGVNAGFSPLISLGSAGDAATGWWDEGGTGNGRALLARKRAGGAWSAPAILDGNESNNFVFTGVDGAGDVTAAYTGLDGGAMPVINVANWPAAAAAPTVTPFPAGVHLIANDLAVNSAGDAVISALTNTNPAELYLGYRHGFGGAWQIHHYDYATQVGFTVDNTDVAINAAGTAVFVARAGTGIIAGVRTPAADWPTLPESVTLLSVQDIVPTVGIDGAGNVWTAFTYNTGAGTPVIVRTALRPPGGGWQTSPDLSSSAAGFEATQVQIAINPSGAALLAWKQTGAALSDASIQSRFGTTGTGLWGGIQAVNDAGADTPVVAISNDGRSAVAWERETGSGNIGQARIREPGAGGQFGDIHNLSALHANYTKPSISSDGLGDFATASTPYDGSPMGAKQVLISVYDAAPPTLSTPTVSGTLLAGDPVTIAATATDEWSSVPAPAWTFGDGAGGTGTTVTHTYAAAGTYAVHVAVTDGSGNSAAKDISVTIGSPQATLTAAAFAAKWKVSRVTGTLTVTGTAPRAGTYVVDVFKGKVRKLHVSYALGAGAFTRKLKLPAKFLPGSYTVQLIPGDAQVKGATRTANLPAPASGVVDVAFLSGARNGTAARTLTGATTIWASFHFAARPKGSLTLTWYKLGKKRVRIGATSKSSATKVVSFLRIGKTFVGTYQAVLSRKGVVIARASVKTKKG